MTPSRLFNHDNQTWSDLRVHGRTSDIPPTGTGRHTGLHTAGSTCYQARYPHPPTNLVDWWIVDGSSEGSAWWIVDNPPESDSILADALSIQGVKDWTQDQKTSYKMKFWSTPGSQISGSGRRGVGGDIDRRDDGCHGDSTDASGIDLDGVDCGCDGDSGDGGADGEGFRAALASTSAKVLKNDRARRRKARCDPRCTPTRQR